MRSRSDRPDAPVCNFRLVARLPEITPLGEHTMRPLFALGLLGAALATAPHSRSATGGELRAACVPTAPMPISSAPAGHVERMPVFKRDSASRDRMPTSILTPCYLADSLSMSREH